MKTITRNSRNKTRPTRAMLPPSPRSRRRKAGKPVGSPELSILQLGPQVPRDRVPEPVASVPSTVPVVMPHVSRDSFDIYLREIGQTALLTPQEELDLARRVQAGDLEAREQMIKANLRLVVKIAREYEGLGVPLLDLISEGNMGLMKGVERFDPDKGAKLSTYAAWWIKQNIRRALDNQSKTVRLPSHVMEKRVQIRGAEAKLQETLGRMPTDLEVAKELGLDAGWVRHYRQALISASSFDAPMGTDEESSKLLDVMADPSATSPFDDASTQADNTMVHEVLDTLNAREQEILKLRFGLSGDEERTLEEIGAHFGLTRERIRQIQERALHKLRYRIEQREAATATAVSA